jgi:hypothetical protein
VLDNHRPRYLPARIPHQVLQQTEFFGSKFDPSSGALGAMLHAVQFQIFHYKNCFRRQMAAPQQSPNASRKFAERKWLGQIVIGAGVQALHPVFNPAAQR